MSGVRRLLKLRLCSPVSAMVALLLDRLRLRFLFLARLACHSSAGHTSEVNFCSGSTSCGEEEGELVCSWDLSEMGERIWSLLMIRVTLEWRRSCGLTGVDGQRPEVDEMLEPTPGKKKMIIWKGKGGIQMRDILLEMFQRRTNTSIIDMLLFVLQ